MRMSLLAILSAALLAPAVDAAPLPAEHNPWQANKAKVGLAKVIDFEIENQSMVDLARYVKETGGVEVVVDTQLLLIAGIDPNSPVVTVNRKKTKLGDGLAEALAPLNLRYGVVGSRILISTDEGITQKQMGYRLPVAFSNKPLAAALNHLAVESGATILLDPRLKKAGEETVSLDLENVRLETAVRLTAELAGLRAVRLGNVLFVTDTARGKVLREDADGPAAPVQASPPAAPLVDPNAPQPNGGNGGAVPPPFDN